MLLLVLLLVVRLLGLLLEVLWLPLYPWDAWTTWAVRAQVWTQSRDLVPFVDPEIWLNASTGDSHSIHAWHYPLAVSLLAAWPALAFGHWQETVANLPWIGCVLALVLGFYGQSVHWGATRLTAMVFTWLLLSLPLLSVHVALAGYADIWLATALGLSFFALMHWLRWGDWRQALLALLLAICCVLLKREGLVWVLLLLPAVLAARLRRRWLLFAMFAVFGLVATIWGAGGLQLHVPMLGEVVIAPDRLELPGVGAFQLQFSNAWEPLINHLYLRDNWHLLPFLVPVALLVGVLLSARDQTDPSLRAGLVWVMSSLFAVYILFFWTDASAWALQGTSINRILLHFAPAMTFWILTIWLALRQVGSTRSATLGGVRQG